MTLSASLRRCRILETHLEKFGPQKKKGNKGEGSLNIMVIYCHNTVFGFSIDEALSWDSFTDLPKNAWSVQARQNCPFENIQLSHFQQAAVSNNRVTEASMRITTRETGGLSQLLCVWGPGWTYLKVFNEQPRTEHQKRAAHKKTRENVIMNSQW